MESWDRIYKPMIMKFILAMLLALPKITWETNPCNDIVFIIANLKNFDGQKLTIMRIAKNVKLEESKPGNPYVYHASPPRAPSKWHCCGLCLCGSKGEYKHRIALC